jgi:SNF2 family DNA or RNA helicase
MLRLNRVRLEKLLEALKGLPNIYRFDRGFEALQWVGDMIPGVHEFLKETSKPQHPIPSKLPVVKKLLKEFMEPITPTNVDGSTSYLSITLPSRNSKFYDEVLDLLKENRFQLEPSNQKWWLRDRHKVLNFLANYWDKLKTEYDAVFSSNFKEKTSSIKLAKIDYSATDEFDINLSLSTPGVNEVVLRENLARGQFYVESGKDAVTLVPPSIIEKLARAQRDLSGQVDRTLASKFSFKLKPAQLPYAEDLMQDLLGTNFETPETWKDRSRALKEISRLKMPSLPEPLFEILRGYQRIGVAWLFHLYNNHLGGVLADEMGLGKTVQALGFIHAINQLNPSPSLVVCPAGLLENWRREAKQFTPSLKVFCHRGQDRLQYFNDFDNYDIIVTSYGTLIRDIDLFRKIDFNAVVADEAQHIKNKYTQNARALRSLCAKGRVLLTGTPIENSVDDLRSLFEFLMPGYLAALPSTLRRDERQWHDDRLRAQVSPYILRRSKALVAPELPEKIEKILFCEMDSEQRAMYNELKEKTQKTIFELEMSGASDGKIRFKALTQLLRLRQICADPRLLDETALPENSAKLRVLRELIEESIDGNHRMLIFSQFVSILQFLKQDLESQNIKFSYIDGDTKNRVEVCEHFNNDNSIPVFLISLKAGGTGLNLTGADTVVHFDPWWNPAVEAQATDRTHRIGQKKVVTSIKLIVCDTVEERVLDLQRTKAHLLENLLDSSNIANATVGLDDIKALII